MNTPTNTKKVAVVTYVTEIVRGTQYGGNITIAGTRFDYELIFVIPIDKLGKSKPCATKEDVRRQFPISIKRGEKPIELTTDEYGFFYNMLAERALSLYNNPQDIALKEKTLQTLQMFAASISSGISSGATYDFPPELCEMLSNQKFGCTFSEE